MYPQSVQLRPPSTKLLNYPNDSNLVIKMHMVIGTNKIWDIHQDIIFPVRLMPATYCILEMLSIICMTNHTNTLSSQYIPYVMKHDLGKSKTGIRYGMTSTKITSNFICLKFLTRFNVAILETRNVKNIVPTANVLMIHLEYYLHQNHCLYAQDV